MAEVTEDDRLAIREPPKGWPIMYQVWDKLLFLHWPVPVEQMRPLIPESLEIDTFDGKAWIGVVPFTMYGIRPAFVPPIPFLSSSHELNVRTYVHRDGVPGVWFFSLDAANPFIVIAAKMGFGLPYYHAKMELKVAGKTHHFRSHRNSQVQLADLNVSWTLRGEAKEAAVGSLDFFLVERYCLYAVSNGQLYRARIHHHPWPLSGADVESLSSTMVQAAGLEAPAGTPLAHALTEPLTVKVWYLERV